MTVGHRESHGPGRVVSGIAWTARIWNDRLLAAVWAERMRLLGVDLGRGVRVLGSPIVERTAGSRIVVGPRSMLVSRSGSTALGVSRPVILRTIRRGARIEIGADVGLSGTTICAAWLVSIGDRVLVGSDVLIADTDFHVVDALPRRYLRAPEPRERDRVIIGADAFIGARTIVLSGSTIGEGSVIGAGSVVKGEIPAGVIAAGNPCRIIRTLSSSGS